MSLKRSKIQKELYDALLTADREVARQLNIAMTDLDTGQKRAMRWSQAKAMGEYFFTLLTEQAEIDIPAHQPNAQTTSPSGGPIHTHTTNQGPITHTRGKIV